MRISLLAALAVSAAAPAAAEQPVAPTLEFAFEETVSLGEAISVGETALGGRNIIPITGGTFEGPGRDGEGIKGVIVPDGWDWQLMREDGCVHIKADYMLQTDDGAVINVVNQGIGCRDAQGAPLPLRTTAVFEPPLGKYEWLGQNAFVGTLEVADPEDGPAVKIRFYRVK